MHVILYLSNKLNSVKKYASDPSKQRAASKKSYASDSIASRELLLKKGMPLILPRSSLLPKSVMH